MNFNSRWTKFGTIILRCNFIYPKVLLFQSTKFDTADVKFLDNNEHILEKDEKKAISRLRSDSFDIFLSNNDDPVSYFEKIDNNRRKKSIQGRYVYYDFISATLVTVQRLFNSAIWILNDLRKSTSTDNI